MYVEQALGFNELDNERRRILHALGDEWDHVERWLDGTGSGPTCS